MCEIKTYSKKSAIYKKLLSIGCTPIGENTVGCDTFIFTVEAVMNLLNRIENLEDKHV